MKSNPDDPAANLVVGKWKCFQEGDWESGLPLLAKSGDETLAKLAKQELLRSGESVDDRLALGDAWWNAAEKAGPSEKADYLGRAYDWYVLAQPNITASLDKLRIQKRLEEIGNIARPTPPRPTAPPSRQVRRGLKLDGKSFIQTNLVYGGSTPITIEAVVVPLLASRHQAPFCNLRGKGLGIELYRGRWQFTFHDSRGLQKARASQPVEVNRRVVIAGVFDGRTIRLFLNGELQSTTAVIGHRPSPLQFKFGAVSDGRGQPVRLFVGVIEAVRVSKEALYSESYELAEELEPTKSTILLLKLDEGEGAVAHDSSVHKNHCQIVGAEWITLDEIPSN